MLILGLIILGVGLYFMYMNKPKDEDEHDFGKNREQYLRSQLK